MKIPPAWKPDEWVCHHSSSRQSTKMDDYYHRQSNMKSATTSRNFNSSSSPKRISTAKLRRQIENLSLKSAQYRLSTHQSNVKRLNDSLSPKSYKSFLSYSSRRLLSPPIRIPKMSKQSLKRWLDARDAYLGHNYPYIIERPRRRRRRKTKSSKDSHKMIDYEEAMSMLSIDSDGFTVPELISSGQQRRLSRKDSHIKPISRSDTNLRRSGGLFQRIKSFVQSPVASLGCLSLRKQQRKKTQIIHDAFDDKCIGREINDRKIFRSNIQRHDQGIQANLPRPQIELHYEYDTSMVEGEKKQRIRSVRRHVEYSDKATETDFIVNFANVEKERRGEEKEVNVDEDDKATRRDIEQEKIDPYTEQSNVEQDQLPSMSDTKHNKPKKNQSLPSSNFINTDNRIVPLTDLFETSINNDKQNGSRLTILTTTESNTSVHEQLHR